MLQAGPGFPRINGYRHIDLDVRKVTLPKARDIKEKNGNEIALHFQLYVMAAELQRTMHGIFPKLCLSAYRTTMGS